MVSCCRSVLNVVVRCAEDLLKISYGLLVDGCLDSENRAEKIEEKSVLLKGKQKRQTDVCDQTCSSINDSMVEPCVYDCFQAEGTEMQLEVRVTCC